MDPDSDQGHEQFVKIYCFFKEFSKYFSSFFWIDFPSFFFMPKLDKLFRKDKVFENLFGS